MEIERLEEYSIKFAKILKKIKRCSGTIFIYSNFKEYAGIKTLCKILEYNGYKNYIKNFYLFKRSIIIYFYIYRNNFTQFIFKIQKKTKKHLNIRKLHK